MNTVQLECFVAVTEHLNFSKASEELNISQPAVTHQIHSLENELNVNLFVRTSKSVKLTEEGILFLSDARYILKTSYDAKTRLQKHGHPSSFDIGCHTSYELQLFPPILFQLHTYFPNVRPVIHFFPPLAGSQMIDNKKIHVSFGFQNEEKAPLSLKFKPLVIAQLVCICSASHPFSKEKELTKNQLNQSFVTCEPHQIPSRVFAIHSEQLSKISPQEQFFAPNIESTLTMVKAQLGYTLYFDIPALRNPSLCYIPVKDLNYSLPFGIFYHSDNDSSILKQFIKICEQLYKQ